MDEEQLGKDSIWVVTSEPVSTRGGRQTKPLKVEWLAENVNLFVGQIGALLDQTPEKVGKFQFEELEVYAEISGKGTLVLFGTGGEVGATGGLRFVFRRSSIEDQRK